MNTNINKITNINQNIAYLIISILFSIIHLFSNTYDIDNSIKIKGLWWKSLSQKYFSFIDYGITHYQDNIIDTIIKICIPSMILFFVLYKGFQQEISTLYFMNIIVIILSILLFIYSTFVYNKLNKEVCSYTQLSIPSFDLENILYLIPKITFVIISLFLYANNTNYLIRIIN